MGLTINKKQIFKNITDEMYSSWQSKSVIGLEKMSCWPLLRPLYLI